MNSMIDILDSITDAQKSVLCERYLSKRFGNLDIDGSWYIEDGVIVVNETRRVPGYDSCWRITHRIMQNGEVKI